MASTVDLLDQQQSDTIRSHFPGFLTYVQSNEAQDLRSQFFKRSTRAQQALSKETVDSLRYSQVASILDDLFSPEGLTFSATRPIKWRLKSLLWGEGLLDKRFSRSWLPWKSSFWQDFVTFVKAQLLAWFHPEEYGVWDHSARRGLRALGLAKALPVYRKSIGGKHYVRFNAFLRKIKELMAEAHLPIESLVDVGLFLNFVSALPSRDQPRVEEEDLSLPVHRDYLAAIMGVSGGFFGAAFIEIGLTASVNVFSLYGVAIILFLLGLFRGSVFQRLVVGRTFKTVYKVQRVTSWITFGFNLPVSIINAAWFYVAFTLAHGSIPLWAFVVFGLSYLVLATIYNWLIVLDRWREGRLFLLQFLSQDSALPEAFSWLKRGILRAVGRLRRCGVSIEPGPPLLGCCFAILNGTLMDQELETIADWVATPGDVDRPWGVFETLLFHARQAEREGIRPPVSRRGRLATSAQQLETYLRLTAIAVLLAIILAAAATGHLADLLHALATFGSG